MSFPLKPRKVLNKAYLKVKPNRLNIEAFKVNLIALLDHINDLESEEFHKNLVSRFLHDTYYGANHFINTKGRNDLVIHNGKDAKSSVGLILEAKKPKQSGHGEMLRIDRINTKALQELVLYYLRERISEKNLEVKHLVATNIYEWFIFDAAVFEKAFAQNKVLVRQFTDFEEKRLAGHNTDFFYKEIAEPAIAAVLNELVFTHFNILDYNKPLRNADKEDDIQLIVLFKLLSPEHLLKLPFTNDSNSLDKQFYSELLHIIGLTEIKEGNKKLIDRKPVEYRNNGSLIESSIKQLDSMDKISRLERPFQFGSTNQERLYNVALELAITWINRILFLKLLEAQLISYHKGDRSYAFLNSDRIHDFDDLNTLFFSVLAKKTDERDDDVQAAFAKVPYLNSSLFDPTEIEQVTIVISNLRDDRLIPILPGTVLKDAKGKKRTGDLNALSYIFEFLNAYDFGSEGSENIQEDNKTLINASVLGLIFEKINGYKDGSFFTPGFITMYMCRETIRQAILQKFNEVKGWNCTTIDELYVNIKDKKEANAIINSLKICDPAVGSGHFLVSALNEIISVKSDLHILLDRIGRTLRDYTIEVVNDELILTDDDGKLFEYHPGNKESQRIQEALFHEKQTIIENCLFGVDINHNSVKICRLRLWIELLKNAYYRLNTDSTDQTLETLPNIDINIKTGNSLISRFPLDSDMRQALKKSKWNITSYRNAVQKYRNPENKSEKREMEKLINNIKSDFSTEISANDPKLKRLRDRTGELNKLVNQILLFKESRAEIKLRKQKQSDLEEEINKLTADIEEIKSNKIYENAFEWRFEFPEILTDDGDFKGFDLIIGNPPYGVKEKGRKYLDFVEQSYKPARKVPDSYFLFTVLSTKISKPGGYVSYIVPNTFCDIEQGQEYRNWLLTENNFYQLYDSGWVFEDAVVDTAIFFLSNSNPVGDSIAVFRNGKSFKIGIKSILDNPGSKIDYRTDQKFKVLLQKITSNATPLGEICKIKAGVKLYEKGKGNPTQTEIIVKDKPYTIVGNQPSGWRPLIRGGDIARYSLKPINEYVNYGKWLAAPREASMFEGERILIRRTDDVLRATYVDDISICVNSCHVLKPLGDINILYLLGLINSRLIQWVFEQQNPQMIGKAFAEIKVVYVENLPFIKVDDSLKFENLISQIILTKRDSPTESTTRLESEANALVYRIFNLNYEEISLIENSTN